MRPHLAVRSTTLELVEELVLGCTDCVRVLSGVRIRLYKTCEIGDFIPLVDIVEVP
jgi:hypothetical protein